MTSNTATATNHSLVGNALQLLASGLGPYVTDKLREAAGKGRYVPDDVDTVGDIETDVSVMLRVMATGWNEIFRDHLGPLERSWISEIREARNRWAHQESFDEDELDRTLDSVGLLLTSVGAASEAGRVNRAKHRLRRIRYAPEAGNQPAEVEASHNGRVAEQPPTSYEPPSYEPQSYEPPPAPADTGPATPVDHRSQSPYRRGDDRSTALTRQAIDKRQRGDHDSAIADLGKAINSDRENPEPWYQRGLTWGHMGQYQRAMNDFNRAISLDRGFADAYNGRGFCQLCLGDYHRAISDFQHALDLDPDDTLTRTNLEIAHRRLAEQGERQ